MIFTLLSAFCRLLQDDLIVQKCFVRYCFAMDHIQQHLTGSPSQLCDIELQRGYGNRCLLYTSHLCKDSCQLIQLLSVTASRQSRKADPVCRIRFQLCLELFIHHAQNGIKNSISSLIQRSTVFRDLTHTCLLYTSGDLLRHTGGRVR